MSRPPRFPDVEWYCDHCGAHLNSQSGFDDHKYIWKCTKCGGKNSISQDNIRKSNDEAINGILNILDVLRTACMHCLLMALVMLFLGTAVVDLPKVLSIPAIAYPVLLVLMLLVVIAGHFNDVGIIGVIVNTVFSDVVRPYRELFRVGRIFHDIRIHTRRHIVLWSLIKLIFYIAIVAAEILFVVHLCTITWGSVGAAINACGDWLSEVDNLRDLYIPFMIFTCVMILVTFTAFGIDKRYAVRKRWRVKEPTLFALSIFFGAVGAVAGMYCFRHKINKPGFRILLPILALAQLAVIAWASVRYFA